MGIFGRKTNQSLMVILIGCLSIILISDIICPKKVSAADFNSGNLISDGSFINIDAMDQSAIGRFLTSQGSYLKDHSENGRSAAQIIYDAAHGYGDASGNINGIDVNSSTGTVNPQVILATLQKEQSLISKASQDVGALNKAMGYGCPDSGSCNSAYAGFTKQVEWASWQLRYNYERASGRGFSDYQVGQTMNFSNTDRPNMDVTLGNRATASLYRYTPHTYNGNYNFWNLYFNTYDFEDPEYSCRWAGQSGYPVLKVGESYNFQVSFRNTGRTTWTRNLVHLGTSHTKDRIPSFLREDKVSGNPSGWIGPNRITMQEESVAPGQTATFSFYLTVTDGTPPGTYKEYFQLVAEGITWMEDYGVYWEIKVPTVSEQYSSQWAGQNNYPTLSAGQSYNFQVSFKNTGYTTWTRNIVHLGTSHTKDRIPSFIREDKVTGNPSGWVSPNRITMQQESVAPGQTAAFSFWMTVPQGMTPQTYKEYFQLVAEGITWMEDYGVYWEVGVR